MQLLALLVMPSSIWVGFMGHDEWGCLIILITCVAVFYAGYFLTRFGSRL